MKIVAVTNLYPPHYLGGYELICRAVVRALWARGHAVTLLTSDYRGLESVGGERRRGNSAGAGGGASGLKGRLALEAGGGPDLEGGIAVWRKLRLHGFFGNPWLGIRELVDLEKHNNVILREVVVRVRPDLVYVWNMGGLSKSMLFTLERMGLPTVFYLSDHWLARGLSSDVWLRWWNERARNWKQRVLRAWWEWSGWRERWEAVAPTRVAAELRLRRLYFCSQSLKSEAVASGLDVGHAAVIYCPVDTVLFQGLPRPVSEPYRRLLYVGRLAPDKGVMTALRAMALLKGRFEGRLSVYGGGEAEYVRELKAFVREQNLPVTFGARPQEEMPSVYREHDGLLFTSEWDEPFALTPLEAMASGLAVIGTRTGGSAELFRDAENCLVYEAGNAGALAECVMRFAGDPGLRCRCAAAGYCQVQQRYAEPVIVDQIEAYLEETVAGWREEGHFCYG